MREIFIKNKRYIVPLSIENDKQFDEWVKNIQSMEELNEKRKIEIDREIAISMAIKVVQAMRYDHEYRQFVLSDTDACIALSNKELKLLHDIKSGCYE